MTITTTQIAWLIDLLEGNGPWDRIHDYGGLTGTQVSLWCDGLLDLKGQLTAAGRDRAIVEQEKSRQRKLTLDAAPKE